MARIIRGKYIITNPALKQRGIMYDAGVYVCGDKVQAIDEYHVLKDRYPTCEVIGNGKQLIMPGIIDAHSHGRGLSPIQKGVLTDYLENNLLDWAFMPAFSPEITATLCSIRHIVSGCTTVHNNGFDIEGSGATEYVQRTIEAYLKTGIRLAYSPGVRNVDRLILDFKEFIKTLPQDLYDFCAQQVNQDSQELADNYFTVFEKIYSKYNNADTRVFLSPSWAQACTPDFLHRAKARAKALGDIPLHMHCLQTPIQKAFSLRKYGKTAIQYLQDLDMLGSNTVLAHSIWLTEADIELLAASQTSITTHPSCNLAMRNGLAPIYALHAQGVNIAMGMDDKTINDDEDAIMEMRMLHKLHRIPSFDLCCPALDAFDILKMATLNAAKVLGFENNIGSIAIGMQADLLVVDLENIMNNPWVSSELDIAELLIHRGMGRDVNTVLINGQVVMRERKILTLNEAEFYEQVREAAQVGLSKGQRQNAQRLAQLKPYYQAWYNSWLASKPGPLYNLHTN